MPKPKIVVSISAKIEWLEPPKDKTEEIMREHTNMIAAAEGKKLETAVQLLIAELLNAQVGN